MPEYIDQFWIVDPFFPPAVGTNLTVQKYTLTDQDSDSDIGTGDTINGLAIDTAYPNETVTVQVEGGSFLTVTGTTFYLSNGTTVFTPTDGSVLEDGTFVSSVPGSYAAPLDVDLLGPPCLTAGTLVETNDGPLPVEALEAGAKVLTKDGRLATLRMALSVTFDARQIDANHNLRPVRIVAGALGNGHPRRDLLVSRQHRMLVDAPVVQRALDVPTTLISAIKLTHLPGFYVDTDIRTVTYFHLVFDAHEIIFAEGAATESLYLGGDALRRLPQESVEEILTLFPDLSTCNDHVDSASHIANGASQKKLVGRIANKPDQVKLQASLVLPEKSSV